MTALEDARRVLAEGRAPLPELLATIFVLMGELETALVGVALLEGEVDRLRHALETVLVYLTRTVAPGPLEAELERQVRDALGVP